MKIIMCNREDAIDKLRIDLSVRVDNEFFGSGLGGDPSLFFFLMSHNIVVKKPTRDEGPIIWTNGAFDHQSNPLDKGITLWLSAFPDKGKYKLVDVRNALATFVANHPDNKEVTFDQLKNLSWLKDQNLQTQYARYFMACIKEVEKIKLSLDEKMPTLKSIQDFISKERESIYSQVRSDFGLKEKDPVYGLASRHPVYGPKIKELDTREERMRLDLIGEKDLTTMKTLVSFGTEVFMLPCRALIGIERLIKWSLDEIDDGKLFKMSPAMNMDNSDRISLDDALALDEDEELLDEIAKS